LKAANAPQDVLKAEIAKLLELKKKLPAEEQPNKKSGKQDSKVDKKQVKQGKPDKQQNGVKTDSKADKPAVAENGVNGDVSELQKLIESQGTKVRELKSGGADKSVIDAEVKVLLDLKSKLPAELQPKPQKKKGKKGK